MAKIYRNKWQLVVKYRNKWQLVKIVFFVYFDIYIYIYIGRK